MLLFTKPMLTLKLFITDCSLLPEIVRVISSQFPETPSGSGDAENCCKPFLFMYLFIFQERFNKYLRVGISVSMCCMEVSPSTPTSEVKRGKKEGRKKENKILLISPEPSPICNILLMKELKVTSLVQEQWSYCVCCH